ncbi:MAG: PD-(D/E)XK nuclease family protein [Acidobacteria bacterium]|nr:PD-(D/E)XK nuclease family protein [Acidobacteriota bacterium]
MGEGRTYGFGGGVDRIDRTAVGILVVVDYKTGRSNVYQRLGEEPWAIYAGSGPRRGPKRQALPRLQLPLYSQAVRQMVGAEAEVIAGYWFVTAREDFRWLPLPPEAPVQAEMQWTLAGICDGIAGGVFPAYPRPRNHPSHCDYCDADRHRAAELTEQILRKAKSPELLGWLRVGARELLPTEESQRLADGPPAGDVPSGDRECDPERSP